MHRLLRPLSLLVLAGAAVTPIVMQGPDLPKAFITGDGWTQLTLKDFENVNGTPETWTEKDGVIICSGKPNGGARMKKALTNFEMVVEWKHHVYAGNAGVFVWCPESAFTDLPAGTLPRSGIEVQVLDLGRSVEPLLHPRNQRRGATVGQRQGSQRRQPMPAGDRVPGA